jgi:phospholipase C
MAGTNQLGSINHVVLLMLENRSFDHMLGFLYSQSGNVSPQTNQPFEGLTGSESNLDASGTPVPVVALTTATPSLYFMPGADPGEGYSATNLQLFGQDPPPSPAQPTNAGFVTDFATTLTGTDANRPIVAGTVADDIMGIFTPALLPVLSGLAEGFAVCDQWFSSVPTETFPNRAFASAATSQGHMNDSTATYTCQSIFGLLSANGLAWSIYGYDDEPLTRLNFPDTTDAPESHFGRFADFQAAAAAGTLGVYTFLEPSWGSSGNSQHPNYDVSLGEQLIHDVYYALLNGPAWDQTLLIVTYDEHGGCYDHVAPPGGAVPPDDSVGEYGFDFTRFGVRVPAVLVSPLIAPGTVFRTSGAVPFDHASILKTVETRWQLPALTARDAAAPDVGDVLTLATPRTDDPLVNVVVPTSTGSNPAAGTPSHIQQVQAQLVSTLPVPDTQGQTHAAMPKLVTEKDYDDYIRTRTQAWKASRTAS